MEDKLPRYCEVLGFAAAPDLHPPRLSGSFIPPKMGICRPRGPSAFVEAEVPLGACGQLQLGPPFDITDLAEGRRGL